MDIFWLIWMLVLPFWGITMSVFFVIFVFFIMPPLARKITKKRFSDCAMLPIATDSGYVDFKFTKGELPEGIVSTPDGSVHFLPHSSWQTKKERKKGKSKELLEFERIGLRKYTVKGFGKPIFFGYAGKVGLMNPATLAALEQNEAQLNPETQIQQIEDFIKDIPEHFRKPLKKMVKDLRDHVNAKKITYFDPAMIKRVIPRMIPPSLLGAYGKNRIALGMELRGKEYGKLILGAGLIIGLVIIGIVAIMFLR